MRLIVSCVRSAQVDIYQDEYYQEPIRREEIATGLLMTFAVAKADEIRSDWEDALERFVHKLKTLKLMEDVDWRIAATLLDHAWSLLVISNFSLYGGYKSGSKVDFSQSASYVFAQQVYERFLQLLKEGGFEVKSGEFGASMAVHVSNYGPLNYVFEL